jgi:hypothetical protein
LYIEAFGARERLHTHPEHFYNDLEGEGSDSNSDSGDEDLQEVDHSPLSDFEAFARRRPGVNFTARGNLLPNLGSREMDLRFDSRILSSFETKVVLDLDRRDGRGDESRLDGGTCFSRILRPSIGTVTAVRVVCVV